MRGMNIGDAWITSLKRGQQRPGQLGQLEVRATSPAAILRQFVDNLIAVLLGVLAAHGKLTDEVAIFAVTVVATDAGIQHSSLGHDLGSFGWLVDRLR
jgi:hypothetical protein